MKTQTVYLAYSNLTPNLNNPYPDATHHAILGLMRQNFFTWQSFFNKHGQDYSLGFYLNTKKGTENLILLGPSISKKMKLVDYSIFLPDKINSLNHYIDLVFEGIAIVLTKYGVKESEIAEMKAECKQALNL